jgi:16S rRNA (cytosine1402-N4)-methyltransferase|tara:strand:+ start:949 stop:1872 length:924 start_codon:yes stop_codon:yes gene_type:complete
MEAHRVVLQKESVQALVRDADGEYVDCTYGRGGHTEAILEFLNPQGRLLVIDKDLQAIEHANRLYGSDGRVTAVHGSFADLKEHASQVGLGPLSGVLMDLGVSSPQLENGQRGFSFEHDGPLDMRMNQSSGVTAAEWLASVKEGQLADVIWKYGEEKFSRRIARTVVRSRIDAPIETTGQLVRIIEEAVPTRERKKHPATRSFQAIRIFINNELGDLEKCLQAALQQLNKGGRLVVISFQSLEDRIVKRFIRDHHRGDPFPARLPVRDAQLSRKLKHIGKAIRASREEIAVNIRARSAVMRVAEKIV